MKPAVDIKDYAYQYPGREVWALSGVNLSVRPGECVCLTGPSGCGKSTLFLAIKGLLKSGREKGSIRVADGNGHARAGLVFQNAESQLLCTTVADEVAFGPQNFGFDQKEIETAVKKSLERVSLTGFETWNVEALSAGQTHRLAIASVLSTAPGILLLDEPAAQLDAPGKDRLRALLKEMKAAGHTLIIADHDLDPFETLADRYVFMEQGRIQRIDAQIQKLPPPHKVSGASPSGGTVARNPGKPILAVEGLFMSGNSGRPLFDKLRFQLMPGRRVFIHGHNGVGKSTLLKCLAGLVRPEAGSIELTGMGTPAPDKLLGKMGLLFQNPERQLFEDTVQREVAFSLKRMGLADREIRARVEEALDIFEVGHLADRSPLTLSFGEQHRVALASVIAPQPDILMLDEPFAGLDFGRRRNILKILSHLCQTFGKTVVIASHEPFPYNDWADDTLFLTDGHFEKMPREQ
ncbi:cobalt ABC transporter, ATP-binding protein [delta proteobacterium NaphS2]|nr:cobalt ABC transporter, ATP-binding protein [delta proteobacterium NaphS2]